MKHIKPSNKRTELPSVSIEEAKTAIDELRQCLMAASILKKDLRTTLFHLFGSEDSVSIHELERALTRKPLMLEKSIANTIARYAIESNKKKVVKYNELIEKNFYEAMEKIEAMIEDYSIWDKNNEEEIRESLTKKLAGKKKIVSELIKNEYLKTIEQIINGIGIKVTNKELDYLRSIVNKNSFKIALQHLVDLSDTMENFADLKNNNSTDKKSKGDEMFDDKSYSNKKYDDLKFSDNKYGDQDSNDKKQNLGFKKDKEKSSSEKKSNISEVSIENKLASGSKEMNSEKKEIISEKKNMTSGKFKEDDIEFDEEKLIEMAQSLFVKIAKKILAKGISLPDIYGPKLTREICNGEEVTILPSEDFIQGLEQIGLENLKPIEYSCLIKVLALNDEEQYIKFDYLIEILSEYGIDLKAEPKNAPESPLNLNGLDNISIIIMLAISEYVNKTRLSLQKIFGEKIYTQEIQTELGNETVEILNSDDFFDLLEEIGVGMEDKHHENLQNFLCIDTEYKDKFMVAKIERIIGEFNTNEKLKQRALECYNEMANEMGEEENFGEFQIGRAHV